MSYDTAPYIGVDENGCDAMFIDCRVTWTPRGGETVVIEGDHLNNWEHPTLACGLEEIVTELGLWDIVPADYSPICRAVNRQLELRPWAELKCPHGKARLELVPVNAANTPSP